MSNQNDRKNVINQNKKTNSKVYPERKHDKKTSYNDHNLKQNKGISSQKKGKSRYYRKPNRYNNYNNLPKNENARYYNPHYYYKPQQIKFPQFIIPIQQNPMDPNSLCCSPQLKDTILLDTPPVNPYKYDFSKANTKLPIDINTIDDLIEIGDRYHEFAQNPIYLRFLSNHLWY